MRLADLSACDRDAFIEALRGVWEHSPWVAERAWEARPFVSLVALHAAMAAATAIRRLEEHAREIASRRTLDLEWKVRHEQATMPMDPSLTTVLERAATDVVGRVARLSSGAGHDALVMAGRFPSAMLMLRSPGGISHHPSESVIDDDVANALVVGRQFLDELARSRSWPTE